MESKHTPGPWQAYRSDTPELRGHVIHCGGPARLAIVPDDSHCHDANARLIGCAPELLAALELAKRNCVARMYMLPVTASDNDRQALSSELVTYRAAIAKARGETT